MNSGDDRSTDMSTEIMGKPPYQPSLLRNWMSLTGLVVVIGSLFSFFMLLMLDAVAHRETTPVVRHAHAEVA